jgi:hypothetical protein
MTTNEQAPTGGERILRGIEFYKAIVEDITKMPEEQIPGFSITGAIQKKIEGLTEDEALEIYTDIGVLAASLDVFGQAFGLIGKAKFEKGASNVS